MTHDDKWHGNMIDTIERAASEKAVPQPRTPVPIDLDIVAEDAIRGYLPELSANLTQTTYESLRNTILTARTEGYPVDWVLERAKLLFSAQRAQMIATTEVTRLFNLGAMATYEAIGLTEFEWQTVRDPWVCFPAGTLVETTEGPLPIERVIYGTRVRTQTGTRVVTASAVHSTTSLVRIDSACGILFCTPKHPLWIVGSGWVGAGNVRPGDIMQRLENNVVEVERVTEFSFAHTKNNQSGCYKQDVLSGVIPGAVPICSVNLQGNIEGRQIEVDAIPPDLELLHIFDTVTLKRLTDTAFERIFSPETTIACERTEPSSIRSGWHYPECKPTSTADDKPRRSIAYLRTESGRTLPSQGHVTPTACTYDRSVRFGFAGHRAVREARGVRDSYGEALVTTRAEFFNTRYQSIATDYAAKTTYPDRIEQNSADLTSVFVSSPGCEVIAQLRAIDGTRIFCGVNGLTTSFAGQSHTISSYHKPSLIPIAVFDIQVENDDPSFFAEGVLVHNCDICAPKNGTRHPIGGDGPPAHPRCRCLAKPVVPEAL